MVRLRSWIDGQVQNGYRRLGHDFDQKIDVPQSAAGAVLIFSKLFDRLGAEKGHTRILGTPREHLKNMGPDLTLAMVRMAWSNGEHPLEKILIAYGFGLVGLCMDVLDVPLEAALVIGTCLADRARSGRSRGAPLV
jgi:hypothetical protein